MNFRDDTLTQARSWLRECDEGGGEQDMDADNLFALIGNLVKVADADDKREGRRTVGMIAAVLFGPIAVVLTFVNVALMMYGRHS